MLSFMKSRPAAPLVRDQAEIDASYRHWRLHILLTMYLGYAVFYFTRKSFNFAMPDMLASGILDKADIGMMWTLFYLTYGCSKFVSGIISKLKPESVTIETPTATIGVRGTRFLVKVKP